MRSSRAARRKRNIVAVMIKEFRDEDLSLSLSLFSLFFLFPFVFTPADGCVLSPYIDAGVCYIRIHRA